MYSRLDGQLIEPIESTNGDNHCRLKTMNTTPFITIILPFCVVRCRVAKIVTVTTIADEVRYIMLNNKKTKEKLCDQYLS